MERSRTPSPSRAKKSSKKSIKKRGRKRVPSFREIPLFKYDYAAAQAADYDSHATPAFTGNRDTDALILSNLNGYDLYNACYSSRYLTQLCDDYPMLTNRIIGWIKNNQLMPKVLDEGYFAGSLYDIDDYIHQLQQQRMELIYVSQHGFVLHMNEKNEDAIATITFHGPVVLTRLQLYDAIKEVLDDIVIEQYKNHVYLEGITGDGKNYYFSLGS